MRHDMPTLCIDPVEKQVNRDTVIGQNGNSNKKASRVLCCVIVLIWRWSTKLVYMPSNHCSNIIA